MQKVKIKFCDFWKYFNDKSNYFYNLLSKFYDLEISDDPEIVIYSSYGTEYLKYNCVRIFYTADNMRPDFTGCDFAISFDYNDDPRHFRLPLYFLYIDQHPGSIEKLNREKTREEALNIWRSKTKFCCMVVSNSKSKKRIDFFEKLSAYKIVDSGGTVMNNVGEPVKNKIDFIKEYRFVFAFENSAYPGYTTEKILEPFIADCIPLYWGNPLIEKDFNIDSFLNLNENKTESEFIEEILAIEGDEEKAIHMLMQPKFRNSVESVDLERERLILFFETILEMKDNFQPVATSSKRYLHIFKLKRKYYINRILQYATKTFQIKN